jgi:hypothetical protein
VSPLLAAVGPLKLGEHLVWFFVLSLFVFLVYNGLRVERVADAVRRAVRRWLVFMACVGVLALVSGLLAQIL